MNIVYLNELKEKGYSQSVRDYSPRGYHTVPVDEVKPGDEVLINNHWHTVIQGQAHVAYKHDLLKLCKSTCSVKDDSPRGYHDVPVDQIRPGDVVLVGFHHYKVRDLLYKLSCEDYSFDSTGEEHPRGESTYFYHSEEEAMETFASFKRSAEIEQKYRNSINLREFTVIDLDVMSLDEDLDWWELDDSLWVNMEHFVTSTEEEREIGDYEIIIPGTNVVMESNLTEDDALYIISKYNHEDRANKEEQIGYILRNTLTGEETLIDC